MSLEIGVPIQTLIELDTRTFRTLLQAMQDKAKEQADAYKGKRGK